MIYRMHSLDGYRVPFWLFGTLMPQITDESQMRKKNIKEKL